MKSTTLRRSNITREKVAMMEALSRYNRQHQDEDFYKAQNKTRELDVLWQSFGVKPNRNEKAPQVYFVTGLICGVIITLAITTVISLLINITTPKDDIIAPSKKQARVEADAKFSFIPADETKTNLSTSYLLAYVIAILPPYECPKIIGLSISNLLTNSLIIFVTSSIDKGKPITLSPKPGKSIL